MRKPAWMTEDALALVRTMALDHIGNAIIAREVTQRFGHFVGSSMIAGAIHRMKLPKRTRKPRTTPIVIRRPLVPEDGAFDWHTGPLPAWGSFQADEFVRESKERSISTAA